MRPLGSALSPATLMVLVLLLVPACGQDYPPAVLSEPQLQSLARSVKALQKGEPLPELEKIPSIQSVYLAWYDSGRRIGHSWQSGAGVAVAMEQAAAGSRHGKEADHAELSLAYGFRPLDPAHLGDDLSPVHRGVRGVEIAHGGVVVRFAPSQMIADNLSFERALTRAAAQLGIDGDTLLVEARLATFDALQVVIDLRAEPIATQLFRGNHTLPDTAVTGTAVEQFATDMAGWMQRNLHENGRMTYLYYPTSDRESDSNNMIRQWMASLCLTRMGVASGDEQMLASARLNIRHNLDQFYSLESGLGIIEYRGKVKLGAVALAALAILEHPDRARFAAQFNALVAMTDHLWRENGSFQTFYRPAERSANPNLHNFYPGETLLLWATMLEREDDAAREARFMQSFRYYREWHLAQRKPSFIPWHTQAYYLRWQKTGSEELRDWIFEMNDWLLTMQTHSRLAYDDTRGRFYDPAPERAHFGPPHASSTGVYLEGLIDAYQLALAEADKQRARAYRESIRAGLRSAMQLQLRNDETLWFAPNRERAVGGLRTTVYNNVIRVDNVQHTLMGVMKMLEFTSEREQQLLSAGADKEALLPLN